MPATEASLIAPQLLAAVTQIDRSTRSPGDSAAAQRMIKR
jgi:hypothetical protein